MDSFTLLSNRGIHMNMAAWSHPLPETRAVRADDTQCVLDLVHLSRQTLGDRALEMELLELFERQATSALSRLTGLGAAGGVAGADVAHMLKGSARAVGAFGVARTAGDLEEVLRTGGSPTRQQDALARSIGEARETIAALLA